MLRIAQSVEQSSKKREIRVRIPVQQHDFSVITNHRVTTTKENKINTLEIVFTNSHRDQYLSSNKVQVSSGKLRDRFSGIQRY